MCLVIIVSGCQIWVEDKETKKGEIVTAFDIKDASFVDVDFPGDLERAETF